jgi:N-acetylglucosamine kinase-like BadF-type ATPase
VSLAGVLAVDGGNSKTDLALVSAEGELLALARGPLGSPHHIGIDGCLDLLESLLAEALAQAGLGRAAEPVAEVAELLLAGLDFPIEEEQLHTAASARSWAVRTSVANDTFAILRAGTEQGWGVAVVCGAGINCVGVAPDGRTARFPALGAISGDWGGGYDLGLAALAAAMRSADGRGPRTVLERAVPAHFGMRSPPQVAEAIHLNRLPIRQLMELAPVVLAQAPTDEAAAEIVDRLVTEVVALVRAALQRLRLMQESVEVILGGSLLQHGDGRLLEPIEAGIAELGPSLTVRKADSPPIVGAALLGLDRLGAPPEAKARLREGVRAARERPGADATVEERAHG